MIDSVSIFFPGMSAPRNIDTEWKPYFEGASGKLGTMRIKERLNGLYIEGSLPKYLVGNNVLPFSRTLMEESLYKIEKESGLDLKKGILHRFEVGTSFVVDAAPADYLSAWGSLSRFKKVLYGPGESVIYRQRSKSFIGYDKGLEVLPKKLPPPYESQSVLRLELRIRKGVKRFLGKNVSPWDLSTKELYNYVVNKWGEMYYKIPKHRNICLSMDVITPKIFERAIAAVGFAELGSDRVEQIIRNGVKAGILSNVTASRIRVLLRNIENDERISDTTSFTAELDEKVDEVVRLNA